jgi:hypothetical protein
MKYKIVAPPKNVVIHDDNRLDITLTRYLYIKEEVMISLVISILEKNREESLFWAYELYWSGFQEETFEFLMSFYGEMFESLNPRLKKFLQSQVDSWKQDHNKHFTLGTIVRNLADKSRKFQVDTFVLKVPPIVDSKIKDHKFYIELEDKDITQYDTISPVQGELPRLTLGKVCRFSTRKEYNNIFGSGHKSLAQKEILDASTMKWDYYASFSPVWKERIEDHNGKIDDVIKRIVFDDEDDQEEFYDRYGYEPDEQCIGILSKITHVNTVIQMSLHEFSIKFCVTLDTLNSIYNGSSECHQHAAP